MLAKKIDEEFHKTILDPGSITEAVKVEEAAFKKQGEQYYPLYIVCRTGRIIGFRDREGRLVAIKEILRDWDKNMYCYGTAVLPKFQKMGLGTMLTKLWEREAASLKMKRLFTLVSPENGANLNSYINKTGFKAIKLIREAFGEKGDYGYGLDHFLLIKKPGEGCLPNMRAITEKLAGGAITLATNARTASRGLAAVYDNDKETIGKMIERKMEMVALVRKHNGPFSVKCDNNIFIFKKRASAGIELPPIHNRNYSWYKKSGFRYIVTSNGCDESLRIEKNYIPEATIYHLRSISIVGGLLGKFAADKLAGVFGVLLPLDNENGLYLHGPFCNSLICGNSIFFKEALNFAKRAAVVKKIHKIWTILPERRNKSAQALFDFLASNGFCAEVIDRSMFANSSGIVLSKNIR